MLVCIAVCVGLCIWVVYIFVSFNCIIQMCVFIQLLCMIRYVLFIIEMYGLYCVCVSYGHSKCWLMCSLKCCMGDRLGSLIGVHVLCVFVGWKCPCVIGVGDVVLIEVSSAAGDPDCLLAQLLSVMRSLELSGVVVSAYLFVWVVAGSQMWGLIRAPSGWDRCWHQFAVRCLIEFIEVLVTTFAATKHCCFRTSPCWEQSLVRNCYYFCRCRCVLTQHTVAIIVGTGGCCRIHVSQCLGS